MAQGRLIRDSDSIDSDLAVLADVDSDSTASGLVFPSGDMDQAGRLPLILDMDMERLTADRAGDSGDPDGEFGDRHGEAIARRIRITRGDGAAWVTTDIRGMAIARRTIIRDIRISIRRITTRTTTETDLLTNLGKNSDSFVQFPFR